MIIPPFKAFPAKVNIPWGGGGEFLAGDTQFDWFSPSQRSAPPARHSCLELTSALLQAQGRREGAPWHLACNSSISARQAGLGLRLPTAPSCCHDRPLCSGDPGKPDAGGQGKEGQRHGWGDAICQGLQPRAESGNSCPSRPRQLIVEAAGGRRAFHALLKDILPFSSLP